MTSQKDQHPERVAFNVASQKRHTVLEAPGRRRSIGFSVSLALVLICLGSMALLSSISRTPVWRLIFLFLIAHIPYAIALLSSRRGFPSFFRLGHALVIAALLRAALVLAPPTFSDDIYRYIWDGRVLLSGVNPYKYAPIDDALNPLRDANWSFINHPELRTIYPPMALFTFAATAFVSPSPTAFKAASALADMGVVLLVFLLLGGKIREQGIQETEESRKEQHRAVFCALAYGLNPLACVETAMSGHLEPFAVVCVLAAIYAVQKKHSKMMSIFMSLAVAIKLVPIVLLPILAKKRIGIWLVVVGLLVLSYGAFSVSAGKGTVESLDVFARRWEGNGGLFAAVKWLGQLALGGITGARHETDIVHIQFLDPLAMALQDTFFSLHKDSGFRPDAPGSFPLLDLSLAIAKIVMATIFFAVLGFVVSKKFEPVRAGTWIFGTLVLVTPVLHPWYILWILPFAILSGAWSWLALAGLSILAYVPLEDWWSKGAWETPLFVPFVEYGAFLIFAILLKLLDPCRKAS